MRSIPALRFGVELTCILAASLCLWAQEPSPENPTAYIKEVLPLPPRAAPSDYLSKAQAGSMTIAAEFTGHSIPTLPSPLTTEDYVVVEAAVFGPSAAKLLLSSGDFSLRINGKKQAVPSQPYGLIVKSLKDPDMEPPSNANKSKTNVGGNGQGESSGPPPPVKIPIAVKRNMEQRVQKASLPEGERALPQAGLLFFPYRGKTQNIRSIELLYEGPAGKAKVVLQ